jgi:putative peptidoglycan lipid II flippase
MKIAHNNSFFKKLVSVSFWTVVSKALGFLRTIALARFAGASGVSDAFLSANRIPYLLRRVFADGALTASFVPRLIAVLHKDGIHAASKLVCAFFILIQTIMISLCILIWHTAPTIIRFTAPGFSEQMVLIAVPLLRVLVIYIVFIAAGALLAGALQAIHHFFIPSIGQIVLNISFIIGILICAYFVLPIAMLPWAMVVGAFIYFLLHMITYIREGFFIEMIDKQAWHNVYSVLKKFMPCLLGSSVVEINYFIDGQFASYLPQGSIAMMQYATDFMRIPLGIFIAAFSTILLPRITRVGLYAPKRLGFYLYEATKFVTWVTMPIVLLMAFFSREIFQTMFLSQRFTMEHVITTQYLLLISLCGLFFFSINKIMLTVYYAQQETFLPTIISITVTAVNTGINFMVYQTLGANGLIMATTFAAGILQSTMLAFLLKKRFKLLFYGHAFWQFALKFIRQLTSFSILFLTLYFLFKLLLITVLPTYCFIFFTQRIGLWLWVGPIAALCLASYFFTRKQFGIKLFFIDS